PASPFDPLGHYGQEISVEQGLVYPNGVTEWIPVGEFRIDDVDGSLLSASTVQVVGVSREAFVADDRLLRPRPTSGPSAQALSGDMTREALRAAIVSPSAARGRRVPKTVIEDDRWGAIAELAAGIGAVVYAGTLGR